MVDALLDDVLLAIFMVTSTGCWPPESACLAFERGCRHRRTRRPAVGAARSGCMPAENHLVAYSPPPHTHSSSIVVITALTATKGHSL